MSLRVCDGFDIAAPVMIGNGLNVYDGLRDARERGENMILERASTPKPVMATFDLYQIYRFGSPDGLFYRTTLLLKSPCFAFSHHWHSVSNIP